MDDEEELWKALLEGENEQEAALPTLEEDEVDIVLRNGERPLCTF